MVERTAPRSRRLGPDDLRLWRHVTQDVTPLRPLPPPPDDPPPPSTPPASTPRVSAAPTPRAATPPRDLTPGKIADVDRSTGDKLRRGNLAIDGRLDLHGLTQTEAHEALDRFLSGSAHMGRRCVLVITGKGVGASGGLGGGVLRQAVPRWLNEAPNRARILAVMPAQPRHGGAGALYVLLKRKR
jgi:DNA-nicking Smr family endonuclease